LVFGLLVVRIDEQALIRRLVDERPTYGYRVSGAS
jgi:hypothetical protein